MGKNQIISQQVDLQLLLSLTDQEFLREAYRIFLKREPDEVGLNFYQTLLINGKSRLKILDQLFRSDEFKKNKEEFSGCIKDVARLAKGIPLANQSRSIRCNILELLVRPDAEFLSASYKFFFGRAPDQDGFAYYMHRLEAGKSKIDILKQITFATEAEKFGADIEFYRKEINTLLKQNLPFVGKLFHIFSHSSSTDEAVIILQLAEKNLLSSIDRIDQKVQHLSQRMATVTEAVSINKCQVPVQEAIISDVVLQKCAVIEVEINDQNNHIVNHVATATDFAEKDQNFVEELSVKTNQENIMTISEIKIDPWKSMPLHMKFDAQIKDLLEQDKSKVFWAGQFPPFAGIKASTRIYDSKFDYRLPANFHQQFNLVYLTEKNLGSIKAWPMIVDEALRLLAPSGRLMIKFSNTSLLSVHELKNLISVWGDFSIDFEHTFHHGPCLFSIKNNSNVSRVISLNGFSFGVITDGKRPEIVKQFVESIGKIKFRNEQKYEIIICGPKSLHEEYVLKYGDAIKFINQAEGFDDLGWITRKKNQIVEAAAYENLIVAHDRYVFTEEFAEKFDEFGPDFSVVVCRQNHPDGHRIPDWVTLGSEWGLTTPSMLEYGDWNKYTFINGGIMIAKKAVLKKTPWNELLFWAQAEDVELTRRLRSAGNIPRLARHVEVISTVVRKGFVEGFEYSPVVVDKHMLPAGGVSGELLIPVVEDEQTIFFTRANKDNVAKFGIHVDMQWMQADDAIHLYSSESAQLIFKVPELWHQKKISFELEFNASYDGEDLLEITMNDYPVEIERIGDEKIQVKAPLEAIVLNNIIRLCFKAGNGILSIKSMFLRSVYQQQAPSLFNQVISFNSSTNNTEMMVSGWSNPEDWGCWSLGGKAQLIINHNTSVSRAINMSGHMMPFLAPNEAEKIIGVMVNNVPITAISLKNVGVQAFNFVIPHAVIRQKKGSILVSFVANSVHSPKELGMSEDGRLLSMGLIDFRLDLAEEQQ